jgi:hypothetical protein
VALGLALGGCHYRYDFNGALIALPKAQDLFKTVPNIDIILVAPNGIVFPKDLLIRQNTYAVVWVTAGKNLKLTFKDSRIVPSCDAAGQVCTVGPLNLPQVPYEYGGTVDDANGNTSKLDPHLVVVP